MNHQKMKEDENRELQKRTESTRGAKVQKLEIREALMGKKSSENNAFLVVALVHGLDQLDCGFILYGTRMLMVVVKLFNDQRRKEEVVVSTVNFMLQEERIDLGEPSNCVVLCRLVILEAVENSASSRVG